jgi:hypothetical protein
MGILDSFEQHKELLVLIVATIGGAFALWRWMVDQKWRRVQHAQSLVEKFLEKKNTIKAFEILDTIGDVECVSKYDAKRKETINITDEFLIGALSTFDQKKENDESEIIMRDIFDDFFDDLSTFQGHIESGLIKLQDIKPYLEYWMSELGGHGRIRSTDFADQVARCLNYFRFERTLTLARSMGYPFKILNSAVEARVAGTSPATKM